MCIVFSDWLFSLSKRLLLMVIGSCFSRFTPNRGVISVLFVIRSASLIRVLLYSILTHTFPKNLFSLLFTSFYLSFSCRMTSGMYRVGLLGMMVTERAGVDDKFLFFLRVLLFRRCSGRYFPVLFYLFICVISRSSWGSLSSLSSDVISPR